MANKDPQCLIIVKVKEAHHLPTRDTVSKSDPYCRVKINQHESDNKESKENVMQTKIIFNQEDNIKWNEKGRFCVVDCNTEILFEIRDDDDTNYDQISTKSESVGYYVHLLNGKDFDGEEQELTCYLRNSVEAARKAANEGTNNKKDENTNVMTNMYGKRECSTISISITAYKLLTEEKIDAIQATETAKNKEIDDYKKEISEKNERIKRYEKEMKDKDATISDYAIKMAKLKQQISDAARILQSNQYK
eukprot:943484_1